MKLVLLMVCALFAAGCETLLPSGQTDPQVPWKSFAEARAAFDRIVPRQTTMEELRPLGFDPFQTPNITILNYADMRRRFLVNLLASNDDLDPALRDCLAAREACRGYESDQKHVDRKRIGSFWLDLFAFRRTTNVTGWQFNAIVVLKNDLVVYKLWSGQPTIKELEESRNPLGPFQGAGDRLIPH